MQVEAGEDDCCSRGVDSGWVGAGCGVVGGKLRNRRCGRESIRGEARDKREKGIEIGGCLVLPMQGRAVQRRDLLGSGRGKGEKDTVG